MSFSKCFFYSVLLLASGFIHAQVQMDSSVSELFSLSFDELLGIQIKGAAVKDLGFETRAKTENVGDEKIFDLPYSIESITNKTIQARNLKNTPEATENTTGVIAGTSPDAPFSFAIRGMADDHVKILYDGINYGIASLNTRPYGTSSIDHIEIYKGPTTFLSGRSGAGGTINIITKMPELDKKTSADLFLSYGSFNSTLLNVGVNAAFSKKIAVRVDFDNNNSDGFVEHSPSRLFNLNASILYKINKKLSTTISAHMAEDNISGYWGTPLVPASIAKSPLDVIRTNDGSVIDGSLRNYNYNVTDNEISAKSKRIVWNLDYKITESWSLSLKSYYFTTVRLWENSENYTYDADINGFARDRFRVDHNKSIYGVHAELLSTKKIFDRKNNFSIKLEYNKDDFDRNVGFINGINDTVSLIAPLHGSFGSVDSRNDFFYEKLGALVIDDNIHLSEKLLLFMGARLEMLDVRRERYNFDGTPRMNQTLDTSYVMMNYKFGLVYSIFRNLNLYSNFAYQHGSIASDIATTSLAKANTFRPSDIYQVEVGTKAKFFNDKVQSSLALFDISRNIQIETPGSQFSENQEKSTGLEFNMKAHVLKNLIVGGNYAFTYSRYKNYYDADFDRIVTGKTPVNVPKHVASLWLSYNEIGGIPLEFGFGCKIVGERMANTDNDVVLNSYQLFNTFLAYDFKVFRTAFHIRNLTNEDYIPWAGIYYPSQYILASPRSYEFTFSTCF